MSVRDEPAVTPATAVTPQSNVLQTSLRAGDPPQIPGYAVQRLLGRGGMGEVWLAEHTTLHRNVALKVLRTDFTSDAEFVERFLREARAAARLNHPSVVTVHDAGKFDGRLYLAMEFMAGGDLRGRLNQQRGLPVDEAVALTHEIAAGLQAIHDAGLVHRDLKPENLLLDANGRVKIADLGLARTSQGDDRMTATGMAMGTPAYMSPEQAQGANDIDGRTDVYALGATLFALLTGRPPFTGATPWVVVAAVMNEPAPDVRKLCPNVPSSIAAVVKRALSKDRTKRYASAQALADDLGHAWSKASRIGVITSSSYSTWKQRRNVLVVGFTLTGIALVTLVVIALQSSSRAVATRSLSSTGQPSASVIATSLMPPTTHPAQTIPTSAEKPPTAASASQTDVGKNAGSNNPFQGLRDGFRGVRNAVRGTLNETLNLPLRDAGAAVRNALARQKLTLLKDHTNDSTTVIETSLDDQEDLTVTLRANGAKTDVAIQVGAFGDDKRSRNVLEWIRQEF